MILRVPFKDPDLIHEYVRKSVRSEKARTEMYDTYFEHGDYGLIELDTKAGTFKFVPLEDW